MAKVTQTVSISTDAKRAWDAIVDFPSRAKWSTCVKSAEIVGGGPLKQGSEIRLHVDKNRFRPKVQVLKAPERLTLLVKGPGFWARHDYQVSATGDKTSVTLTGEFGGPMGVLFGALGKGSIQKDLVDELAAIKKAAEAG